MDTIRPGFDEFLAQFNLQGYIEETLGSTHRMNTLQAEQPFRNLSYLMKTVTK